LEIFTTIKLNINGDQAASPELLMSARCQLMFSPCPSKRIVCLFLSLTNVIVELITNITFLLGGGGNVRRFYFQAMNYLKLLLFLG
jgi:hypothetical protein